jgi:hypothetical protein
MLARGKVGTAGPEARSGQSATAVRLGGGSWGGSSPDGAVFGGAALRGGGRLGETSLHATL